ncbi:MAG: hypothetical protein ACXABY_00990 [Candidatus Thorarchaeota archaeon]|jgi:hypothetical protein
MDTLMRDSLSVLAGLRTTSHRQWFTMHGEGRGLAPSGKEQTMAKWNTSAYLNHGRWIADCPLMHEGQPCMGAECVTEDDPVFFCLSCGNQHVGGDFIKVVFPKKKDRDKVELSLAERPESLRNWIPGETPKKIAKENRKHGIPVPEGAE